MKIIRARYMGMCEGVKRAIQIAGSVKDPGKVTILGNLVHNGLVNERLGKKGFRQVSAASREYRSWTDMVLVTAHGISGRRHREIISNGKEVIDATCPLVKLLHMKARGFANSGFFTVVIGQAEHEEIKGVTEDLKNYAVVGTAAEVARYDSGRIGIVCQTTSNAAAVTEIVKAVTEKNPQSRVEFCDTICPATAMRQAAVIELCRQADIVLVAGSRGSSNTLKLVEIAEASGKPAKLVESPENINPRWFIDVDRVGLSAGASTPDDLIKDVEKRVREIEAGFRELHEMMESRIRECMCGEEK